MRALPRRAATAAATALLLALTACGGDSEQPAAEPSSETPSGSSEESSPSDQLAEGEEVEPSEFVADMKSGLEASTTAQMSMEMDAGQVGLTAEGQFDYTTDPPSAAVTMENPMMGAQQIELRLVDGVMYLNMGEMSNGKFVSYDLSDTANLPPGLQGLEQQMDPLAAFRGFEKALTKVTYEGTEDVGGDELRHYEMAVDPSRMESFQGVPPQAGMPKQITYDAWFDDEFRFRQMTMTMKGATPVEMDIELSEWGEPVDIEAPPKAQVVDGTSISG